MKKVNLTYFKPSGKYYCEGDYDTILDLDYEIYDEVQSMRLHKLLPGLSSGSWMGFILIEPENGVRAMID